MQYGVNGSVLGRGAHRSDAVLAKSSQRWCALASQFYIPGSLAFQFQCDLVVKGGVIDEVGVLNPR